jgi:hypothetical protein
MNHLILSLDILKEVRGGLLHLQRPTGHLVQDLDEGAAGGPPVSGHETARRRAHPLVVMRAPAPAVLMMVIAYTTEYKCRSQCCGSGMFIPDPTFSHPRSRIRPVSIPNHGSASKNLSILTPKKPKKWFLSSRKYDPCCSSRIRMLTFYPSRNPDPGVIKAPDPGSGSATLVGRDEKGRVYLPTQLERALQLCT